MKALNAELLAEKENNNETAAGEEVIAQGQSEGDTFSDRTAAIKDVRTLLDITATFEDRPKENGWIS
jgi:hypothetical protein